MNTTTALAHDVRSLLAMTIGPRDIPEEVKSELDVEERRAQGAPELTLPAAEVPEDVLAERDLEARLGGEELRQQLVEGNPPAEDDPRSR